ncbi:hypothetical protein GXW77_13680 [Roseomonas alkaliterrae]|jgi:hypothetical protein|uniref:phage head-tail joining protein n=1 Tax=Neoroseomonas alkaliterrae TaxID=1452450 RepID=UPI001BA97E48|nr:hypothetical protein [Neoroseomonas alkaliterrae]MBR0677227.1 hypothetical protein [Neoroseomonas alkaliterrae]
MDAVLAWALAQAAGTRWRELAEAYVSGATRVTFEGRTVEYRSRADMEAILRAGFNAENPQARRGPRISLGAGR